MASAATTVSLSFDDGQTTQGPVAALLEAKGMRGTFYVNSALAGTSPFRMDWPAIQQIAAAGHEVSGHSLQHLHLTTLTDDQKHSQICDDRANLIHRGFYPVVSFAYPYGEFDTATKAIVAQCGYTSGRKVGALRGGSNCGACPFAETLPPLDPYATRTAEGVGNTTTLDAMKLSVTQAEAAGGWVQLLFHGTCPDASCADDQAVPLSRISDFIDWLQPRAAAGTVVKTVAEAMGVAGGTGYDATSAHTDQTPPTVALTAPASGVEVSGSAIALTAGAGDANGLHHVDFLVNGTVVATDKLAPFAASWDSTATANGSAIFAARAYDVTGNSATSSSTDVTVANPVTVPPPAVTPPPAAAPPPPPAITPPPPAPAAALAITGGRLTYVRSSRRLVLKFTLNKPASLKVKLERRVGGRWRALRMAIRGTGKIGANRMTIGLRPPRLGRYRTTLTARGSDGRTASLVRTITIR